MLDDIDEYWRSASHDVLIEEARCWAEGWSPEEVFPAEEGDWEYVSEFQVSKLLSIMTEAEWAEWVSIEDSSDIKGGRDPRCQRMAGEDIRDPIVMSVGQDGEILHIWDGWHRAGAAVVKKAASLRAITGTRKPTPSPSISR